MTILKKYRCIGCGNLVNLDPFDLCAECETNPNREKSNIEKEYGTPQNEEIPDYKWFDDKKEETISFS
jgi:hypothetical protein